MKVRITRMKAPWPDGAKIGDVVELPADTLPAWAVNKCVSADTPDSGAEAERRAKRERDGGDIRF